ncbi:MAG: hypothetical protein H8D78_15685 [Chloroflexi bacterium]|nr:hypothetical protein [Chloroflexota bacterium]
MGSVALAAVFFLLDSPYAGAFELSVGAGLVSVLLFIAISLTAPRGGRADEDQVAIHAPGAGRRFAAGRPGCSPGGRMR